MFPVVFGRSSCQLLFISGYLCFRLDGSLAETYLYLKDALAEGLETSYHLVNANDVLKISDFCSLYSQEADSQVDYDFVTEYVTSDHVTAPDV